jgi:hypothetical protein
MTSVRRTLLALIGSAALAFGCVSEDGFDNDSKGSRSKKDAGSSTPKDAGKSVDEDEDPITGDQADEDDEQPTDDGEQPTDDGEQPTDDGEQPTDDGEQPTDDGDEPAVDAGMMSMPKNDAGTTPPKPATSKIKGTGLMCSSYGNKTGEMCAGFYCKVTTADIAAELDLSKSTCDFTPEQICEGSLTKHVAACARSVKMADPLSGNDVLRPKVRDCVYAKDAKLKESAPEMGCLGCFLDAAECASEFCLLQCLGGDSKDCDNCRNTNKCNQMAPACAGLPSPF